MRSEADGRTKAGLLALALAMAFILPVAGCGQQSDPRVRELLKDASAHMSKAAEVTGAVREFDKQWEALAGSLSDPQTAVKLEDLFKKTRVSETSSLDETKAARDDYAKAATLRASAEKKKYIDLRHEALLEQTAFLETELKAMDLRIKVEQGEVSGQPIETLIELNRQISSLEEAEAAHAKRAAALHKQATDYYEEHKLGG